MSIRPALGCAITDRGDVLQQFRQHPHIATVITGSRTCCPLTGTAKAFMAVFFQKQGIW
ncbi:hypothetical protein LU298_00750 [Komagataeibacter intermedius]|uniref:hypothetical protein n=1 Tax=Komagataeibacter intermedius TaxID=66229 RepID=UPI000AC90F27|nr:hypothetical protein [Komagataeibacter intermedius]MCF3635032.1 hypothetical protein [Komagataeibacter intermedius]